MEERGRRPLRHGKRKKYVLEDIKKKKYIKIRQKRNQNSKRKYKQWTCRSLPLSQKRVHKILKKRTTNAEPALDFTEEGALCFYSTLTD